MAALGPQAAARALDHLGQAAHDHLAHLLRRAFGRKHCREAQPLFAIVVAVAEEMLADEDAQIGAQRAREHQHAQHGEGGEEHAHLQRPAPVATEIAHVVAHRGHQQQIGAGQDQGGRIEGRGARDLQPGGPVRTAAGGDEKEGDGQRMRRATHARHVGIETAEEQGLGIQIGIEGEDTGQAQAQRLGVPARILGQVAKQLLDHQQAADRQRKCKHDLQPQGILVTCTEQQFQQQQQCSRGHAGQCAVAQQAGRAQGRHRGSRLQECLQQGQPGAVAQEVQREDQRRAAAHNPDFGNQRQPRPGCGGGQRKDDEAAQSRRGAAQAAGDQQVGGKSAVRQHGQHVPVNGYIVSGCAHDGTLRPAAGPAKREFALGKPSALTGTFVLRTAVRAPFGSAGQGLMIAIVEPRRLPGRPALGPRPCDRACAAQRAPLPVSTTPTVSIRTTRSRNRVWFLT